MKYILNQVVQMKITDDRIDGGRAFDWGRTSADYAMYRDIYPPAFYDRILRSISYSVIAVSYGYFSIKHFSYSVSGYTCTRKHDGNCSQHEE